MPINADVQQHPYADHHPIKIFESSISVLYSTVLHLINMWDF